MGGEFFFFVGIYIWVLIGGRIELKLKGFQTWTLYVSQCVHSVLAMLVSPVYSTTSRSDRPRFGRRRRDEEEADDADDAEDLI